MVKINKKQEEIEKATIYLNFFPLCSLCLCGNQIKKPQRHGEHGEERTEIIKRSHFYFF